MPRVTSHNPFQEKTTSAALFFKSSIVKKYFAEKNQKTAEKFPYHPVNDEEKTTVIQPSFRLCPHNRSTKSDHFTDNPKPSKICVFIGVSRDLVF